MYSEFALQLAVLVIKPSSMANVVITKGINLYSHLNVQSATVITLAFCPMRQEMNEVRGKYYENGASLNSWLVWKLQYIGI